MSLTLALLALLPAQDAPLPAAALHPEDARFFVEFPDLAAVADVWPTSPLHRLLADPELAGLIEKAGLPPIASWEDHVALLPPPAREQVLPMLADLSSASVSLSVDLAAASSAFETALQRQEDAAALTSLIYAIREFGSGSTADHPHEPSYPATLDELLDGDAWLSADALVDSYGTPFVYGRSDAGYTLMALGSDRAAGGVGPAADLVADQDSFYVSYDPVGDVLAELEATVAVGWASPYRALEFGTLLDGLVLGSGLDVATTLLEDLDGEGFAPREYTIDAGDGAGITVGLAVVGGHTILSLGGVAGAVERAVAVGADRLPEHSLAGDAGYRRAAAAVAVDGPVVWAGFSRGLEGLVLGSEFADGLSNVGALFEFFGYHGAGSAWSTALVDGRYRGRTYRSAASVGEAPQRPIADLAALVPADAAFVSLGAFDLVAAWDLALSGSPEAAEGLAFLEGMLAAEGVDLQADLVGAFDGRYAAWCPPVAGLTPPQLYLVAPLAEGVDEARVMTALDAFSDLIASFDESFSASHRPYKDVPMTSMSLGIPIGLQPSWAIYDGTLWFANSSVLVKREIRARDKGEVREAGGHPLTARLDAGAVGAWYLDLGGVFSGYYSAGRSMLGLVGLGGMDLPEGLVEALPGEGIFTRHLQPDFGISSLVEGAVVGTTDQSIGPELLLLAGAAPFALFTTTQARGGMVEAGPTAWGDDPDGWGEDPLAEGLDADDGEQVDLGDDAELRTIIDSTLIDVGLLVYGIETGDYPESLDALLGTSAAYPDGYLGEAELPVDGWGNAYLYERLSSDDYRLWSAGPDGVDDDGAGDDVIL